MSVFRLNESIGKHLNSENERCWYAQMLLKYLISRGGRAVKGARLRA